MHRCTFNVNNCVTMLVNSFWTCWQLYWYITTDLDNRTRDLEDNMVKRLSCLLFWVPQANVNQTVFICQRIKGFTIVLYACSCTILQISDHWSRNTMQRYLMLTTENSFFCCVLVFYVFVCSFLCVFLCTGHFVRMPLNLTYLHCSIFLFNFYFHKRLYPPQNKITRIVSLYLYEN